MPFTPSACVVLGGGGHASVLIDCLILSSGVSPHAVLDNDPSKWGKSLCGVPVRGGDALLAAIIEEGVTHFVVGLGSTGDCRARRRLYELGCSLRLTPVAVMHPSAVCSRWAQVGPGLQLLPAAVINAGAVIGANVITNTGAIVEHDCAIGDHVHIATGARLAGGVRVDAGAHVGAGAIVRESVVIGEGAIVGAGAVVVKDVPARTLVVGVPARPIRQLDSIGESSR